MKRDWQKLGLTLPTRRVHFELKSIGHSIHPMTLFENPLSATQIVNNSLKAWKLVEGSSIVRQVKSKRRWRNSIASPTPRSRFTGNWRSSTRFPTKWAINTTWTDPPTRVWNTTESWCWSLRSPTRPNIRWSNWMSRCRAAAPNAIRPRGSWQRWSSRVAWWDRTSKVCGRVDHSATRTAATIRTAWVRWPNFWSGRNSGR